MKRFILGVALCLMFITPANAIGPNDILLSCWIDESGPKLLDNATTVILSPDNKTVEMIDPRNRLQKGSLITTEYFYTIKIPKNTQFSKIGEIKINRFTGRLSSYWQYPESGDSVSKAETEYGFCIRLSNNGYRF